MTVEDTLGLVRQQTRPFDAEVDALARAYQAFATQPADAHARMLEWLGARLRADATERAREATEAARAERAKEEPADVL